MRPQCWVKIFSEDGVQSQKIKLSFFGQMFLKNPDYVFDRGVRARNLITGRVIEMESVGKMGVLFFGEKT